MIDLKNRWSKCPLIASQELHSDFQVAQRLAETYVNSQSKLEHSPDNTKSETVAIFSGEAGSPDDDDTDDDPFPVSDDILPLDDTPNVQVELENNMIDEVIINRLDSEPDAPLVQMNWSLPVR